MEPGRLLRNHIYNCDYKTLIEKIDDNSVDMILTDVPYLISQESRLKEINDYNTKNNNSSFQDPRTLEWDKEFDLDNYIKHCCRILKPSRSLIIFASWQQLYNIDNIISTCLGDEKGQPRIGIWKKSNPSVYNMDKMALQPYEFFIWNRKGKKWIFNNQNGKYFDDSEVRQKPEIQFFELSSPSNKKLSGKHPTSKPEELFRWLILTYTDDINECNEKSVIFDGCMGGGTTAIAALKCGREFIGFEINKDYCEIANQRLQKFYQDNKSNKNKFVIWENEINL